jgi:hypothetical protein
MDPWSRWSPWSSGCAVCVVARCARFCRGSSAGCASAPRGPARMARGSWRGLPRTSPGLADRREHRMRDFEGGTAKRRPALGSRLRSGDERGSCRGDRVPTCRWRPRSRSNSKPTPSRSSGTPPPSPSSSPISRAAGFIPARERHGVSTGRPLTAQEGVGACGRQPTRPQPSSGVEPQPGRSRPAGSLRSSGTPFRRFHAHLVTRSPLARCGPTSKVMICSYFRKPAFGIEPKTS